MCSCDFPPPSSLKNLTVVGEVTVPLLACSPASETSLKPFSVKNPLLIQPSTGTRSLNQPHITATNVQYGDPTASCGAHRRERGFAVVDHQAEHRGVTTLAHVAQLAGVSVATASKALNNRAQVAPATRERVLLAAEQLDFKPNTLAQSLLSGRSGTIGLVTHDLDGRFSIPILMGVEDAAGTGKMSALLCDARGDSLREAYHLQALLGRRVDGLVVVGARSDPRPSLGKLPVPVVYAYAPSSDPADASVVIDHARGGGIGIEHLVTCGRSRIAVISGDRTYGAANERAEGALGALSAAGLAPWGGEVLFGAWTEAWGRSATEMLLARPDAMIRAGEPAFDGILCGSDQIARGVLDVLRERGVVVPQAVSVVGHDNWEIFATGSRPQLTSVDMHLEQLGHRAAQRLFDAIDGRHTAGVEYCESSLVLRESSAP